MGYHILEIDRLRLIADKHLRARIAVTTTFRIKKWIHIRSVTSTQVNPICFFFLNNDGIHSFCEDAVLDGRQLLFEEGTINI